MSSTNRKNAENRHISDYYITPLQPIYDLFKNLKQNDETKQLFANHGGLKWQYKYIDPCAGGDANNEMSYPKVITDLLCGINSNLHTIDIREDSRAEIKADFLQTNLSYKPNVIIINPPFNLAKEIILKSLEIIEDNGFVIMLLRLNFFGSKDRQEFWNDNMPVLTFVHRKRISFTKGSTDSIEYMHCVWQKGVRQNHTKLIII